MSNIELAKELCKPIIDKVSGTDLANMQLIIKFN